MTDQIIDLETPTEPWKPIAHHQFIKSKRLVQNWRDTIFADLGRAWDIDADDFAKTVASMRDWLVAEFDYIGGKLSRAKAEITRLEDAARASQNKSKPAADHDAQIERLADEAERQVSTAGFECRRGYTWEINELVKLDGGGGIMEPYIVRHARGDSSGRVLQPIDTGMYSLWVNDDGVRQVERHEGTGRHPLQCVSDEMATTTCSKSARDWWHESKVCRVPRELDIKSDESVRQYVEELFEVYDHETPDGFHSLAQRIKDRIMIEDRENREDTLLEMMRMLSDYTGRLARAAEDYNGVWDVIVERARHIGEDFTSWGPATLGEQVDYLFTLADVAKDDLVESTQQDNASLKSNLEHARRVNGLYENQVEQLCDLVATLFERYVPAGWSRPLDDTDSGDCRWEVAVAEVGFDALSWKDEVEVDEDAEVAEPTYEERYNHIVDRVNIWGPEWRDELVAMMPLDEQKAYLETAIPLWRKAPTMERIALLIQLVEQVTFGKLTQPNASGWLENVQSFKYQVNAFSSRAATNLHKNNLESVLRAVNEMIEPPMQSSACYPKASDVLDALAKRLDELEKIEHFRKEYEIGSMAKRILDSVKEQPELDVDEEHAEWIASNIMAMFDAVRSDQLERMFHAAHRRASWIEATPAELYVTLDKHVKMLAQLIELDSDARAVQLKAADVANLASMVHDATKAER